MHNFYNEIPKLLAEKGFIDPYQEKRLETGEENFSEELGGGANETSFVELKTGEKGVFKPQKGETCLRDKVKLYTQRNLRLKATVKILYSIETNVVKIFI